MRECEKNRNLLEKKIITDNCLLRERKNTYLIYWKYKVCPKKNKNFLVN